MNTKEFKTYADKEQFVQGVFSNIAKNYDLMNTVLSFGQDYFWRKFSVKAMNIGPHQRVLDVACGTCVFTKEALRQEPTLRVEALDFNSEMLDQGRVRIEDAGLSIGEDISIAEELKRLDSFEHIDKVLGSCYDAFYNGRQPLLDTINSIKVEVNDLVKYDGELKEVSEMYAIPCVDLHNESGLNPVLESVRNRFIGDGLHPTAEGNKKM